MFTFPPIYPAQPTELRDEFVELRVDNREPWPLGFAEGSPVLVRNFKRDHKLAPYWLPAVVAERVGPLTYKLRDMAGKFALKDLKLDVHSGWNGPDCQQPQKRYQKKIRQTKHGQLP